MPVTVQIPNGTTIEFPEGMSQEDMTNAIYSNFPDLKPKPALSVSEPVIPRTSEDIAIQRQQLMRSTGTQLEGTHTTVKQVVQDATTPVLEIARKFSSQTLADAVDALASAGAQAEGFIDPVEVQEMLAEPSRPPTTPEKVITGAHSAIADAVNFFTSPLGIATLGTGRLPAVVQKTVAGGFVLDMASHAPQQVKDLVAAVKEDDPEKISRAVTGLGLTGTFIGLGTKHVLKKTPTVEPDLVQKVAEAGAPATAKVLADGESKPLEVVVPERGTVTAEVVPEVTAEPLKAMEPSVEESRGPSGHPFPTSPTPVPGTPAEPVRASEIVKDLAELMDRPIRIGHIGGKQEVAGIFKAPAEVARIRVANDIPVATHEFAHGLERVHRRALGNGQDVGRASWTRQLPQDVQTELRGLDYDPKQRRVHEGFAEFVRHWLTLRDTQTVAPRAHNWFEQTFLEHNPDVRSGMEALRTKIEQFQGQGAVKRVESMVAFDEPKADVSIKDAAKAKVELWRGRLADDLRTLEQVEKEMLGGQLATGASSPTKLARTVTQSSGPRAREWAMNGMTDFAGNKVGPGLKEIFGREGIQGDERNAMLYAIAKRSQELHKRGINPGISAEDAQVAAKQLETPQRQQFAEDVRAWNEGALKYLSDAGGVSVEALARITELNQSYIPFLRVFEAQKGLVTGGRRIGDTPKPVKGIKGSGREIRNPIESMIEHANQIVATADKIRVARSLVDIAAKGPWGKYVEEIPASKVPSQFTIEQVKKQLEAQGADLSATDMDAMLTVWKNSPRNPTGANIVSFVRDGKPHYFELHPDLYRTVQALEFQKIHPMLEVFGKITRTVRLGATGVRAGFSLITNPIRDFAALLLQTGGKPHDAVKLWAQHVAKQVGFKDSEIKELWRATGGEISQPFGLDRKVLKAAVDDVLANDAKRKALNVVRHPIETARRALSFTEAAPRLAEFEMTLREMGWKPGQKVTPDMAIEAARRASEVTIDFKRAGSWGRFWNQVTAFYNPSVQGLSKFNRAHADATLKSVGRGIGLVTIPAAANWWLNKDDADWQKMPDWVKYGFLNFKIAGEWVRIPTPFEWWYVYGSVPMAALDSAYRKDPKSVKAALGEAFERMTPPIIPTAAVPALEVGFNESFYTDRPIVPEGQKRIAPQEQALPHTSATAKSVARMLGTGGVEVSPIQIDHLMSGYTGGFLTDAIQLGERTAGVAPDPKELEPADIPIAGRLFIRDSASALIDEFYTELHHVTTKDATYDHLFKKDDPRAAKYELSDGERAFLSRGRKVSDQMSKLRQQYREATTRIERKELWAEMEELAKDALEIGKD